MGAATACIPLRQSLHRFFPIGKGADDVAEKAESNSGWLFPVGNEINELSYNYMLQEYDAEHYFLNEETTRFGSKKLILKNKKTGKIVERKTAL